MTNGESRPVLEPIPPHGRRLVNRIACGKLLEELVEKEPKLHAITIDRWAEADLWLIGVGAYSPLEGFMMEDDYEKVLLDMRLRDGDVWALPITLDCDFDSVEKIARQELVKLIGQDGELKGFLAPECVYPYDRLREASLVFGTRDPGHPGVARIFQRGPFLVGGKIWLVMNGSHDFSGYRLTPFETRSKFLQMGWKTVVAFQTRNPLHRAHEYIQKCALEIVDGLFLHPLVGDTKGDDVSAEVRMKSYEALISNYFPPGRVLLAAFPAAMRYAGPREAIFHALVRKNYGCTHIVIGRDHAGVGGYYGPYEAQRVFDRFEEDELGIKPLFFEDVFYCTRCESMASLKTCPHSDEFRLTLSGTKVRAMLERGLLPPRELIREEVARILMEGRRTPSECAGFSSVS